MSIKDVFHRQSVTDATVVLNGRVIIVSLTQRGDVGTVRVETDFGQAIFTSPDLRDINLEQRGVVDSDDKSSRDGVVDASAISAVERVRRAINSASTPAVSEFKPNGGAA